MSTDRHPSEEAIARELRLRPERPPVTRHSRKVLAGLAGVSGLAVLGALIWALDTGERRGEAPQELYTTDNTTTSDRLQQLPRDYTEVPKLGPPLPGDLGRPILRSRERDGLVDAPLSQPDPEEQRRQQEAETARVSGLFASGVSLANGGLIPFVCAASPFLTGRALEQIKTDVAYSRYPVVLCGMSPGLAYGELGPTHHSIEDFSWLRAIADLNILVPADPDETRAAVRWAARCGMPVFMRVGRFKVPAVTANSDEFAFGKIRQLRSGDDPTIAAIGTMVSRAIAAASLLSARGIEARVLNVSTLKPLDQDTILAAARQTGHILTVEEAVTTGGLGAAVAAIVVENHPVAMKMLGVLEFAPTGSAAFLLDHFALSADGIAAAGLDLMSR